MGQFSFAIASLYFVANTQPTGSEVFVSDGTALGTHVALEVVPGFVGGNPRNLTFCNGDLFFFSAVDASNDQELYRLVVPDASVQDLGFGFAGAQLTSSPPVLGRTAVATLSGAPTGSIGLLGMSAVAAPSNALVVSGMASWIDPFTVLILGAHTTSSWSVATAIPAKPSLAGLTFNLQAWFLPAGQLPAQTSNGLRLVLGD